MSITDAGSVNRPHADFLGWLVCYTTVNEAIIVISSYDLLVELNDTCRLKMGSAHGCRGARVSFQWGIKTVRQPPAGSFAFISALTAAIKTEKQNRIRFGRSLKL